jgi:hypothetical protein
LDKWIINNDKFFLYNPVTFSGRSITPAKDIVGKYWEKPGDVAIYPALYNSSGYMLDFDDRTIEDASFMRLKSLTLSYSLPEAFLKKTKLVKGARIYFSGRNLLTWTKYSGQDPEINTNLALGNYPNTKQYSFGIELTF